MSGVPAEFVGYYNQHRSHRSLGLETPMQSRRQLSRDVVSRLVFGGHNYVYGRAA